VTRRVAAALLAFFLLAAGPVADNAPPSVALGDLYRAVEMADIFADQKTFADAIPSQAPAQILIAYEKQKRQPDFSLKAFVARYFVLPERKSVRLAGPADKSVKAYIATGWTLLQRPPDRSASYSSLLPLPHPYVVPGGRFSEIYYWDSYFTMIGLEQDGRHALVRDILANFAALIDRYGHIPNGNRSYYLSRSQPPFFAAMVELAARRDGAAVYRTYLPELQAEYDYWMEGAAGLAPGAAHRHVVRLADGAILNRYWDDRAAPRDESYSEDVETAAHAGRPVTAVYRDLRAGAESGWDFSSRWLTDGRHLSTIRTTAILPVDLNCLMVHLEEVLAKAYDIKGNAAKADSYRARAAARRATIRRLMWDAKAGLFTDYLWQDRWQSRALSAATVFPLYFNVATAAQAHAVATTLRSRFLRTGGLATTLQATGEQWDAPNGWAPLQYLAIEGLKAYGEDALAKDIAARWLRLTILSYRASHVLVEKYDVEQSGTRGSTGGEYRLQIGFGWTNGVLAKLMAEYPAQTAAADRTAP
jgi:alpha,alpha-trehalase